MGCLDKVGGTIIALLIIIWGCINFSGKDVLCFIVGGIVYAILTYVIDPYDFLSFTDSFTESPLIGLFVKFIVTGVISAIVIVAAGILFGAPFMN